jgi:hypothetical protein
VLSNTFSLYSSIHIRDSNLLSVLRITGSLGSAHCPELQCLRLVLSKGCNIVGVSLPSPENGHRSCFRNAVF